MEDVRATLETARENRERSCDALSDARTSAGIGQHYHPCTLEVLKRTPELDKVVHAIVAADKRVTRLS